MLSGLEGRRLGAYRIESRLGAGGMGEVYRAVDTRLNRPVAIKFLSSELATSSARRRFQQEAKMASALNHPHILTVHEAGEFDGRQYLVTELVDGGTLKAWAQAEGRPWRQIVELMIGVADALAAAHTAGILHRDIKPDNILVTTSGYAKLADFGLAKLDERATPAATAQTVTAGETQPGDVVGTIAYMSPEQAAGRPLDARSDIFSFGIVLYELLTGRRPFTGATDLEVLLRIINDAAEPLEGDVPPALRMAVDKALENDPADRYPTMRDLVVDLRRVARQSEAVAAPSASVRTYAAVAAMAVVLVVAAVLVWRPMQAKGLTDKDVLVLADFTNTTGEAIFDGTLREALAIQLEESPFLKVLGDEAVRSNLRMMGRPSGERITSEIAREICQRENQKAMIGGSIAALGTSYVITLQSTNCRTGDTLVREQADAKEKEQVLAAIAHAARRARQKLGESLSSIQKLEPPPVGVTTTSLRAFQSFAQGAVLFRRGAFLEAIPLFRRAVELDPDFASGWNYLAISYQGAAEYGPPVMENLTRAYALRDRVTERERFLITTHYYLGVTYEWHKAAESAALWSRTYPRNHVAHTLSGVAYWLLGDFEDALRESIEAYRIEPRNSFAHGNLAFVNIVLDRYDEARTVLQTELGFNPDEAGLHEQLLRIAYIQGDAAAAARQIQWFEGKPTEYMSLQQQADAAMTSGRLREADGLLRRANEVRQRRGLPPFPGRSATHDALLGWCGQTRSAAAADALALALCGNAAQVAQAVTRAEGASVRRPNDTLLNGIQLPMLRAASDVTRDRPAKAIELLQSISPYERGRPEVVHLRGLAYLRARKGPEAAAEFQRVLDHKGANWGPLYATSYMGLARGAALAGDMARAKKAYQDFLAVWPDADADIPLLIEARKEYAAFK
jgi:tetratricopeptide (TPR) repeat protein